MKRLYPYNLFVLTCFFISGAAGLIYQIAWIRTAALIFGSTTFALSTVLAVYFGGMAVGSFLSGRFSAATNKPLLWYAILEIGLAAYALTTPYLFQIVDSWLGALFALIQSGLVMALVIRFVLVTLVLLVPAVLLGATLPLFCRQMVTSNQKIAGKIGILYTINTLGAAIGCLATGYYLIPSFGVSKSIVIGALLSFTSGLIAFFLRQPVSVDTNRSSSAPDPGRLTRHKPTANQQKFLITGLFFITGFIVIGNEVIWTRFLSLLIRNTVYTYTITLSVVLLGIAFGSLFASRLFDRFPYLNVFGCLQILSALINAALMLAPTEFWKQLGTSFIPYIVLMLVPALISGLCFPLIIRLVTTEARYSAGTVGSMTAFNILGGVLGSLIIGFFVLPVFGLQTSVVVLTAAGLMCGAIAIANDRQISFVKPAARWPIITVAGITWLVLMLTGARIPTDYLGPEKLLIDYQEGYSTLLSTHHQGETRILNSDRLWQGTNVKNHQIMAAHIPMILHSDPKQVLVVGMGVGQTASRFLMYGIEQLDLVDIEPALFEFVKRNFDTDWMDDPRVHLHAEDGRLFVNHAQQQYDVISVEVGQVFRPGTDVFYTLEFYQQARQRLKNNGMIAQFVPLAFFGEAQFQRVLATFQNVFPNSVLWYNTQEMLLIGAIDQTIKLRPDRLDLLHTNPAIHADLQYSYWGGGNDWLNIPDNFIAGFLCDKRDIRRLTGASTPYRDDLPELAYDASRFFLEQRNERRLVKLLSDNLSPVETIFTEELNAVRLSGIEQQRDRNLNNILAQSYLADAIDAEKTSDDQQLQLSIQQALTLNPENFMANRMQATWFMRTRQPEQAIIWFNKALSINPDNRVARGGMALAYLQTGRFIDAIVNAKKALKTHPKQASVLRTLGMALASSNRMQEALPYLQQSLHIEPDNQSTSNALKLVKQQLHLN